MAKNLVQIATIVKDYIDDTTITADQHIIDAVNHLSNIFYIPSIDTSQSSVDGETTLNRPANSVGINKVNLAGVEVQKADELDDLEAIRVNNTQRWYEYNGKIQFTRAFTSVVAAVIWYNKGFKEPEAAVDTDVPERYLELIYIGAAYRYYHKLVSKVIRNREDYPDVDPDEIRKISKHWRDTYNDLLDEVKTYAKTL